MANEVSQICEPLVPYMQRMGHYSNPTHCLPGSEGVRNSANNSTPDSESPVHPFPSEVLKEQEC
jgi:hypothetical protein